MKAARTRGGRRLYNLSLITLIGMFFVNIGGFLDTATGSALGCGRNWPFCNGSAFPQLTDPHVLIEFGHRVVVFADIVLLLVLMVLVWRKYRHERPVQVTMGLVVISVILQSALGAMAVLFVNPPAVMATHMGVSLLAFSALLVLTMFLRRYETERALDGAGLTPRPSPPSGFVRLSWFTLVYTFIAIYIGAYIMYTGDGGMFRGWPFPTESYSWSHTAFWLDITHRSIALGLMCLLAAITWKARKIRNLRSDLFKAGIATLVLVCMQAISGGILIYTHLSLPAFLLHVSIITCLFGVLCYTCVAGALHDKCLTTPIRQASSTTAS